MIGVKKFKLNSCVIGSNIFMNKPMLVEYLLKLSQVNNMH